VTDRFCVAPFRAHGRTSRFTEAMLDLGKAARHRPATADATGIPPRVGRLRGYPGAQYTHAGAGIPRP